MPIFSKQIIQSGSIEIELDISVENYAGLKIDWRFSSKQIMQSKVQKNCAKAHLMNVT